LRASRRTRCRDRCAAIAAWTRTLPAKAAEERLDAADVPCSHLYDIADCASDPHFLARGSVRAVDDPLIGRTLHPGPAIRLDGDPPEAAIGWPGPAAGAHTDYVLHTLLGLPE
jgi:crotonobetainyl-CoA:carnitine CoA-transferase CaiB-like acyl-CoA transferase